MKTLQDGQLSMICISCPIGCRLTVTVSKSSEGTPDIAVSGNACPRGIIYGREEALSPKRVVTATVRLSGGRFERLPVKTSAPLPKEYIGKLLEELYSMKVTSPVSTGTVIMQDVFGTGIDVVATRSC